MANIKFSGFTEVTSISGVQEIVGYNGTQNVRITPANLLSSLPGGPFLPLAGGTMTGNILFNSSVRAQFGSGGNSEVFFTGSNFVASTFTGDFIISNYANDKDIIFQSDDGSGGVTEYFKLDGSEATGSNQYTIWPDGSVIAIGTGKDLQLYHNGSTSSIYNNTGNLVITNAADDSDIIFKSDDGSGGVTEYFRLDGAQQVNFFSQNAKFNDNVRLLIGGGNDLQIYHDGSNSYINEVGTGSLYIDGSTVYLRANQNENAIICNANGSVDLYYDGSAIPKLSTTLTGIEVASSSNPSIKIQDTANFFGQKNTLFFNQNIVAGQTDVAKIYTELANGTTASLDNPLKFATAQRSTLTMTDRMVINNLGNVGIGTTSPSRKLEVSGVGSSASTYIKILGDTSQEAILELHADNDAAGDRWRIAASNSAKLQFRSNGTNVLSITSAGNVGIGSTSPTVALDVLGTNNLSSRARFTKGAQTLQFGAARDTTTVPFIGSETNHDFSIIANNTERMRITSAGGISFGSTGTAYGTSGQVLTSNGNAAPTWIDAASGGVPFILGGANFGSSLKVGDTTTGTLNNAEYNVGVGVLSLDAITSADSCVAVGWGSGGNITSGSDNVVIGSIAGSGVSTGQNNVNVGAKSGQSGDTNYNTGVGARTLRFGDAGADNNVAVGFSAGISNKGAQNTILGAQAGGNLTTGANNTIVGYDAEPSSATASNEITLGNSSVSVIRAAVTSITSLSDERDKKDIKDITYGLDFVSKLQPREFVWDNRVEKRVVLDDEGNVESEIEHYSDNKNKKDFGFIAQEVQAHDDDTLRLIYNANPDKLEMSYGKLVPILVKAIQELSEKVTALENS